MHGMSTSEQPAVAIEGLSHFYGARQALDDVSFSIAPSTFAVLLGLNGAGKSTLFSLTSEAAWTTVRVAKVPARIAPIRSRPSRVRILRAAIAGVRQR